MVWCRKAGIGKTIDLRLYLGLVSTLSRRSFSKRLLVKASLQARSSDVRRCPSIFLGLPVAGGNIVSMNHSSTLRFAFNPAGTTLAVVNLEGRFRLFDTGMSALDAQSLCANLASTAAERSLPSAGTGRLQVEFAARADGTETAQPCTCFSWASVSPQV